MVTYIFGIGTGLFLYFAGERFLKFAVKALKERKEKEIVKAEEVMEKIVDKMMEKKKKGTLIFDSDEHYSSEYHPLITDNDVCSVCGFVYVFCGFEFV